MALSRPAGGWQSRFDRVFAALEGLPGVALTAQERASADADLSRYLDLLLTWNQRLDLTAARNVDELVDLFVADAALLARFAQDDAPWVDVGSGAGAPGLPLKLMRPQLRMRLVEPKTKRVTFMRTAIGSLGLQGIEVTRAQSQELPATCTTWAVSRATLPPEEWLREGARIAQRGVWVMLAQAAEPALPGWRAELDIAYRWGMTGVMRRAVRFIPSGSPDPSQKID
jgi:16S rRNA (guanine527-N7)-methyltransferase